jgi:protein arginine N-methyltransferase 1
VKAGAKHVIGVDMSTIIEKAREIVEANGMSDKITLLQGKMEEVVLPFPKVDIIISEWMGYFLLYVSMLDTVLYARDKYLVKDGLIFPDKATIFMAGIEDGEYKEEKIGCKLHNCQVDCAHVTDILRQSGTMSGASTTALSRPPP